MFGAHHCCRALIHFAAAPLSIRLASFSASAVSHKRSLASTFSALIFSPSHQSPSALTAATSDLPVHASLSYSVPVSPARSSLCLSQSIFLPVSRRAPLHWHQHGWSGDVKKGGFTPPKLDATDSVEYAKECVVLGVWAGIKCSLLLG